ncbi:hypothetical protein JOQ06_028240, partial [Pogonophryne albipinna]
CSWQDGLKEVWRPLAATCLCTDTVWAERGLAPPARGHQTSFKPSCQEHCWNTLLWNTLLWNTPQQMPCRENNLSMKGSTEGNNVIGCFAGVWRPLLEGTRPLSNHPARSTVGTHCFGTHCFGTHC